MDNSKIEHPSHYCKGNIMKYIFRYEDKGGAEDLLKARMYLQWLINEKGLELNE